MTKGERDGQSQSGTVVLAEDDDALRPTLAIWLEDTGEWEVREAPNGREALNQIDETVDVLVLDRRMPELTGSEVIERLDETGFEGGVVVLSVYEADSWLSEDHDYVTAYLSKPVERGQFLGMLKRTLR